MRGDSLGYNAPIFLKNGFYFYEDKNFSILSATISRKDIENITAAIKMIKTYKGLEFFKEVENLVNELEKQVHNKSIKKYKR